MAVTHLSIARQFFRGASVYGLTLRYDFTTFEIENIIRNHRRKILTNKTIVVKVGKK